MSGPGTVVDCRRAADAQARVVGHIARLLPALDREVRPSSNLRDELGLDSVLLMTLAFRLEKDFGVDITRHAARLADIRTVAEVAEFFHEVSRSEA